MSTIANLLPYAVGALSLAVAGMNVSSTVKLMNEPLIVEGRAVYDRPVHAGEEITIPWEIRKTQNCPGELARVWRGAGNFYMSEPMRPAMLPPSDEFVRYRIQTEIPSRAPPGDLTLSIVGRYQCADQVVRRFSLGPVALSVVEEEQANADQ